jgi:hypothetical protein
MKLWLDDERDPTDPFIQSEFGATGDEVWVKTASQAIDRLRNCKVTSISLDHDLGPDAGDGYQVACWIEKNANNIGRMNWYVHSMNPVGAKKNDPSNAQCR